MARSSAQRSKEIRELNRNPERWSYAVRSLAVRNASSLRLKGRPVQCHITVEEIQRMGERQGMKCFYSGIPFHLEGGKGHQHYPSLDRTEVDGDYSASNCVLTAWAMNRARGAMSAADFLATLQTTVESFSQAPWTSEYYRLFLPKVPT